MKLHTESESLLSEPDTGVTKEKLDRTSNRAVVHDGFDLRKTRRQFSRQYAHSYTVRLWSVRPQLEDAVKSEWPDVDVKKIAELCEFSQSNSTVDNKPSGRNGDMYDVNVKKEANTSRNSDDHGQHIAFREDVTVGTAITNESLINLPKLVHI